MEQEEKTAGLSALNSDEGYHGNNMSGIYDNPGFEMEPEVETRTRFNLTEEQKKKLRKISTDSIGQRPGDC